MFRFLFFIIIVLFFSNFRNNKNDIREKVGLHSFYPISYAGCISSVSIVKKNDTSFDDTLTAYANYIYDSVISSKVKSISPFNISKSETTSNLKILSSEITQSVFAYQTTKDLNQIPFSATIDSFANIHRERYTSYFINYGNIWTKKQNRQKIAINTIKYSAIVVGLAFYTALIVISSTNSTWWDGSHSPKINDDGYENNLHKVGMKCNYLIYDKQEKKFCYIKSHIFKSDKTDNNPFNPKRVSKQVDLFVRN